MVEFKKYYHEFQKYNTQIYALSVDPPEKSRALKKDMELPFELLCDIDKNVVKQYDLFNPYEHGGIAYPATFIVNPDGKICYRSLDSTAKRVDISETKEFIKDLNGNLEHEVHSQPHKKWVIPSPVDSMKAMRNLIFTSTLKDWMYLFFTPFGLLKMTVKKMKR